MKIAQDSPFGGKRQRFIQKSPTLWKGRARETEVSRARRNTAQPRPRSAHSCSVLCSFALLTHPTVGSSQSEELCLLHLGHLASVWPASLLVAHPLSIYRPILLSGIYSYCSSRAIKVSYNPIPLRESLSQSGLPIGHRLFSWPQEWAGNPVWGKESKEVCWGLLWNNYPYSEKALKNRLFSSWILAHCGPRDRNLKPRTPITILPPKPGWHTDRSTARAGAPINPHLKSTLSLEFPLS